MSEKNHIENPFKMTKKCKNCERIAIIRCNNCSIPLCIDHCIYFENHVVCKLCKKDLKKSKGFNNMLQVFLSSLAVGVALCSLFEKKNEKLTKTSNVYSI